MERVTIEQAKDLFGINFVGADELMFFFEKMGFSRVNVDIPEINYSLPKLQKCSTDGYILILGLSNIDGVPLSIQTFRTHFGVNPDISEPCFYNQDWYLKEDFIDKTLESRWYLIKREVIESSRAVQPIDLINQNMNFPSAILCVYTFFAYFYANCKILWPYDFIWCSDFDHNGDRIYVGKYHDIDEVNKNGFSIHRHLALRSCYAAIDFRM